MNKTLIFVVSFVSCLSVHAQFPSRATERPQPSSAKGGGSTGSFSGVMFDTDAFYGKAKAVAKPISLTSDPTKSNEFDTTSTMYNFKLGVISTGGWYLGALYSDRADASGTIIVRGYGGGAGVGFFASNGLNVRAFYKFSEVYGDYSQGEGFSGEMAYLIKISSKFYFGFLVSHQQVRYLTNPTVTNFRTWTSKWTHPALTLAYLMR